MKRVLIDRTYCLYNVKPPNPLESRDWYLFVTAQTTVRKDLEVAVDSFKGSCATWHRARSGACSMPRGRASRAWPTLIATSAKRERRA
jgi:hypothetical protein